MDDNIQALSFLFVIEDCRHPLVGVLQMISTTQVDKLFQFYRIKSLRVLWYFSKIWVLKYLVLYNGLLDSFFWDNYICVKAVYTAFLMINRYTSYGFLPYNLFIYFWYIHMQKRLSPIHKFIFYTDNNEDNAIIYGFFSRSNSWRMLIFIVQLEFSILNTCWHSAVLLNANVNQICNIWANINTNQAR